MLVEETQTIEDVLQLDPQIKVVSFKLKFQSKTPPPNNTRNAFSIMMGQAKTPKDPMLRSCNNGEFAFLSSRAGFFYLKLACITY